MPSRWNYSISREKHLKHIARAELINAIPAYLLKGGYIRQRNPEPLVGRDYIEAGKIVIEKKKIGRHFLERYNIECYQCEKKKLEKGEVLADARRRLLYKGWWVDGTMILCPRCKPPVEDGQWKPGVKLVEKRTGGLYIVNRYKGWGDHGLNKECHWPELWCTKQETDNEVVFIFWNNKFPVSLFAPKLIAKV